jgi:hypothetical protein
MGYFETFWAYADCAWTNDICRPHWIDEKRAVFGVKPPNEKREAIPRNTL